MVSLPTSPEARPGLLPSESQRIPCPVPHVPRSDLRDWQLLDNAAQKAVATVSMIDCLWEKLTKVSDDVEALQQRLPAEPAAAPPEPVAAPPEAAPAEPVCSKAEMEEFMKVCALEEETNAQFAELKQLMQQKFEAFSEELTQVKLVAEEDKSSRAVSRISKELDSLKESLQAQDQRLDERLKNSVETLELSQSSAIERLRWSSREQMQDIARQEQNLNQVKQMLVDRCDEAVLGLRRLELAVQSAQSDAATRHGAQQICSQQIDGLQYRVESLEGQQLKLSKGTEELRRRWEANLEDSRRALESQLTQELQQATHGMQKQLQAQKQEFGARADEISQDLTKHFQRAVNLLQDQGQKLEEGMTQAVGNLREEVAEKLEEFARNELSQRSSLEERSNALLDLGLQKLAKEVAERMDQLLERQHSAVVSLESRLFEHLESWQSNFQDREAARDVQMSLTEQLQRDGQVMSREIASLRSRLEETQKSIEEGLAASAMNAFQGEMRLWAKMAQFGIAPQ